MCTSGFNTGSCVNRRRGHSVAAGQANKEVLRSIGSTRFNRARFRQCRKAEMHQFNRDQHYARRKYCPNDSRPH
jgi:hypothetical protein